MRKSFILQKKKKKKRNIFHHSIVVSKSLSRNYRKKRAEKEEDEEGEEEECPTKSRRFSLNPSKPLSFSLSLSLALSPGSFLKALKQRRLYLRSNPEVVSESVSRLSDLAITTTQRARRRRLPPPSQPPCGSTASPSRLIPQPSSYTIISFFSSVPFFFFTRPSNLFQPRCPCFR